MNSFALRVNGIGKRYRIGGKRERYKTLRSALMGALGTPLQHRAAFPRIRTNSSWESEKQMHIWALRNVSFELEHGEILGIIGRNGAGKSTLLKVLSRITEPSEGELDIYGRVASLLEVGTGFHLELTGRENVFLNGAILGMKRSEIARKFDEIVAFAEVERFLDTPVKHYSSGMYLRLAFAVAAHLESEILLVDEVLAVGDAAFQRKCLGKIGNVASNGRTVLFVSHNISAIQTLCRRCLLLTNGRLVGDGPVDVVSAQYLAQMQDSAHEGAVDLQGWPNREGTGRARITRLEMTNGAGTVVGQVPFRGRIRFQLKCQFDQSMGATFGVVIHTMSELPLLDLRSINAGLQSTNLSGCVVVEAGVDVVNLYPGQYLISAWISDRTGKECIDFVHHCLRLTIVAGVDAEAHLILDPNWGRVFVESSWRLIE